MQTLLISLKQNRYFLLFVLLFAYAQSIQTRIWVRGELSWYIFTPEAAITSLFSACILFFVIRFFIRNWQHATLFSTREVLQIFISSLGVYMLVMKILGLIIALAFDTFQRNFNTQTLLLSTFSELMDGLIYGSFFLAYHYYKKHNKNQEQLALYNQLLSESKINQLKTQLNPHFLFNNLNVLDQLIEENQQEASDFLNEFADIYRYVLQVSGQKTVPLAEELAFATKYFDLMQHKYGVSYVLEVQAKHTQGSIVPLSLQLLLENAIQHNMGLIGNPIKIRIEIDRHIKVSNNTQMKRHGKQTSGRALANLREQYKLLGNQNIDIIQTPNDFSVIMPILSTPEIC